MGRLQTHNIFLRQNVYKIFSTVMKNLFSIISRFFKQQLNFIVKLCDLLLLSILKSAVHMMLLNVNTKPGFLEVQNIPKPQKNLKKSYFPKKIPE